MSVCGGSPPRVRGKVDYPDGCVVLDRITPACAGKSAPCAGDLPRRQDHPRVCGEKSVQLMLYAMSPGSPPRVRGKANHTFFNRYAAGITPARAGKSLSAALRGGLFRDHPRACGEKGFSVCCRAGRLGSPPRVRGKVCMASMSYKILGITPARAGKSSRPALGAWSGRDHPRACGEK